MKCSLCGMVYAEKDADRSCRGCPMAGSCAMLRCPNCGYETPRESGLEKAIRKIKEKRRER